MVFVDGEAIGTGLWSTSADYSGGVRCAVGGVVFFKWVAAYHDLVRMASKTHYDNCDFDGAETLAPVSGQAGSMAMASYSFECDSPGDVVYLACSVASHCSIGQKVELTVSSTISVHDASGSTLLHMMSLSRMMNLLNHPAMDTGFGTEAQANSTLEMIWCLETHCPDSARSFHPDATEDSCRADVHNLAGYISRSRPTPQYAHALAYYDEALAYDPSHCATLEYRTELHLQTANASGAIAAALQLCEICGSSSDVTTQARAAFAAHPSVAAFPEAACAAVSTPSSPPPLPPRPPPSTGAGETESNVDASDGGDDASLGLVVGCVVGGVVAAALLAMFLFNLSRCMRARRMRSHGKASAAKTLGGKAATYPAHTSGTQPPLVQSTPSAVTAV